MDPNDSLIMDAVMRTPVVAPKESARHIVCTRARRAPHRPSLGREQTVVGYIATLPRPGRTLRVYSREGECVLQSSRIRLATHGPDASVFITKNSTYRVTFVDER